MSDSEFTNLGEVISVLELIAPHPRGADSANCFADWHQPRSPPRQGRGKDKNPLWTERAENRLETKLKVR
ncbi:MAG: hypothetical protein LUB59_03515, partial [Candidatus Gastranaerophilales bacterium]|nr:hypothetical protein [Candidatus Gastranaerophilales bacterium]